MQLKKLRDRKIVSQKVVSLETTGDTTHWNILVCRYCVSGTKTVLRGVSIRATAWSGHAQGVYTGGRFALGVLRTYYF